VLKPGTGLGSSVLSVLQAAERAIGRAVPHEVVGRRPRDLVALFADTGLSREVSGWTPWQRFDDILASAWAWHSTHQDGHGDWD